MYYKNSAIESHFLLLTSIRLIMLPIPIEKIHGLYKTCNYLISTDTRNILPGSLFFCLKGPNFDGNDYAIDALTKGAAYVISDAHPPIEHKNVCWVENALTALQDLALFHRKSIDTHFLAIGGSNGKTTTKELCLAVLEKHKKTKATKANLNNHIGVPLTILELNGTEEYAIIETGTNHIGEMKVLCDIVQPDSGIVTNVGKEHLEGFGSMEAIAREESELYLNLIQNQGLAFVNADDAWLSNMAKRIPRSFTYGIHNEAMLKGSVLSSMPHLKYTLTYQGSTFGPYQSSLGGEYNLYNILAAVAVGIQAGIDIETIAHEISQYVPSNNRSEWRDMGSYKILLDAYNANPSSVELALTEFAKIKGTKAVMLGDMLELGSFAGEEHKKMVDLAQELGFEEIYLCGSEFEKVANPSISHFGSSADLSQWLVQHPSQVEYILIKGSRGMRMENVLTAFAPNP